MQDKNHQGTLTLDQLSELFDQQIAKLEERDDARIREFAEAMYEQIRQLCTEQLITVREERERAERRASEAEQALSVINSFEFLRSAGFVDLWASDHFTRTLRMTWMQFEVALTIVASGDIELARQLGYEPARHGNDWRAWIAVQGIKGNLNVSTETYEKILEERRRISLS